MDSWIPSGDQLVGSGGLPFDDISEIEAKSDRPMDEFILEQINFFAWHAIGAVQCTYRSVIDGLTVSTKRHGAIGDLRQGCELMLSPNEYIGHVEGFHGLSRHAAGGACVDLVDMHTIRVSRRAALCTEGRRVRVASGAAQALGPLGAPAIPVVPSALSAYTARPDAPMHVVRALRGRYGDSLDGLSFVLGPPIPDHWSPDYHSDLPSRTRRAIHCLLLANRREDCVVAKLDRDCLHHLFSCLASFA